ncbi:hypothetical protein HMPREF1624_08089 [Sporothrix schenckii ATCC 58251]|uniref:MICOS complex subunit n=1 Tax=Sporothrix schenckii (strain ATCC 58251 / de Perez 2211183) TaxID=1391915 RepID=U7PIW5_SPOS1|nr:hypothetical protein HMPREF1624_08089 [Sporothrix schenckii ATCC 58251]
MYCGRKTDLACVILQTAAAPVAATLLLGGTMLYPRAAYAEVPDNYRKPIYDDYDAPATSATLTSTPTLASTDDTSSSSSPSDASSIIPSFSSAASEPPTAVRRPRGPTPTDRLAGQIGRARLFLYRQACKAEDGVNRTADQLFGLERSLTETLASLAPSRESGERLLPGAVYVLVAGMAGSIVTRRSNILLRATVPLAFGVGAGWALLPVTMRNCADLAWKYEQRVPAVAEAHLRTRAALERTASFAKVHAEVTKTYADDKVHAVRETVEDWVKQGK